MKVVVVTDLDISYPNFGGARLARDFIDALSMVGCRVAVLAAGPPTCLKTPRGLYAERYVCLDINMLLSLTLKLAGRIAPGLKYVQQVAKFRVFTLGKVLRRVVEAINKLGWDAADVVVAEQPYVFPVAEVASKMLNAVLVLREHNVEEVYVRDLLNIANVKDPLTVRMARGVEEYAVRRARITFTISRVDYARLIAKGLSSVKMLTPGLLWRGSNSKVLDDYVLLSASDHPPNMILLLKFIKYAKKYPTLKFVITGNVCKYVKLIREKLPRNVVLLGDVPLDLLAGLYKHALLVYASSSISTGVPVKLLEALLYGVPAVTNRYAYLALDKPPGVVLEHMFDEVIKSSDLLERLREGARRASRMFNAFTMVKSFLEHVNQLRTSQSS